MASNLFILNDPPYGTERAYNALRLEVAVAGKDDRKIRPLQDIPVFLTPFLMWAANLQHSPDLCGGGGVENVSQY